MAKNIKAGATVGNFVKATGMMPDSTTGMKMASKALKATGIQRQLTKTATAIMAPMGLLALCMLPTIAGALSALTGLVSVIALVYFGVRLMNAKTGKAGSTQGGGFHKSFDSVSRDELEARKSRAYAARYGQTSETITTR